jgi:hypothetical protein
MPQKKSCAAHGFTPEDMGWFEKKPGVAGSGKSLLYQLSCYELGKTILVVSPLLQDRACELRTLQQVQLLPPWVFLCGLARNLSFVRCLSEGERQTVELRTCAAISLDFSCVDSACIHGWPRGWYIPNRCVQQPHF